MSQFEISTTGCKQVVNELASVRDRLGNAESRAQSILNKLNSRGFHYTDTQLKNVRQSIVNNKTHVESLRNALESSATLYERAETSIIGYDISEQQVEKAKNFGNYDLGDYAQLLALLSLLGANPGSALFWWLISKYLGNKGTKQVDYIVFDDEGSYGGDQGHMINDYRTNAQRRRELTELMREYYPNMSDREIAEYLSNINHVGCGYVALVNTIFMQFEGDPEGFERTFGFPMYQDGDFNYDRLLLDLYVTTDKAGINLGYNGLPEGTLAESRNEIINNYLSDKGMTATTDYRVDVNAGNYSDITSDGGKVVISFRYGNMYDANGVPHYIDGGHAMVVTGMTDDGRYIVSSWGEEYFINPSDWNGDDSFSVIHYN